MAKLQRLAGTTSQIVEIFVADTTSTTGAGKTGLTNSSFTCYYKRNKGTASVSVTLDASSGVTLGTFEPSNNTNGAIKEVDSTNMPGLYEFHLANNGLASGADEVVYMLTGTGIRVSPIEIELTATSNQDGVHGGMSALPNTACTTNASLLTSGTGTDQISVSAGKVLLQATQTGVTIPTVTTVTNSVTVGAYSAGFDIATRRGTAQAGAAGSITLDSGASATDHLYERLQVAILSGTGAGQSGRIITGYVGSTKVATTTPNWTTAPDSTSVFALLPAAADIETILNVASFGAAGYVGIDWGHVTAPTTTVVLANTTVGTATSVTNAVTLPSIPSNWITAAGINAGALNGKGDWLLASSAPTNFGSMSIDTNGNVKILSNVKKNTAISNFPFLMTDSTTHLPKTGLGSGVTVTRSLDGAAFGAGSLGAVSEISGGWYQCSFAAADTNANFVGFRATATNADDLDIQFPTQP